MTLWDSIEPTEEQETTPVEITWTVLELGEAIGAGIKVTFPKAVWVQGEIQGLRKPNTNGHSYFSLVEVGAGPGERPEAQMSVSLFRRERQKVLATLQDAPGEASLVDGLEVRIRARVNWWVAGGRLSLQMVDIDPVFTLGRLDEQRRQLLAALANEGLLNRNATIEMPVLPLRVGLVTSGVSAAYKDFTEELRNSGFAFDIVFIDARMQGADSPRSVVAAIDAMAARDVDVVAVVRGGGSVTDLAAFDHGDIARAIATCDRPVITGIGHEIDRSVADEVAHSAAKTPTAAARVLIDAVQATEDALEARFAQLVSAAQLHLNAAQSRVAEVTRSIDRAARVAATMADASLAMRADAISKTSARLLRRHRSRMDEASARTIRLAQPHLARLVGVHEQRQQAVVTKALRVLGQATGRTDERAARIRAHDPVRALARGWSYTRGVDGELIRDPTQLQPGDELVTTVAHGRIHSVVDRLEPDRDAPTSQLPVPETDTEADVTEPTGDP